MGFERIELRAGDAALNAHAYRDVTDSMSESVLDACRAQAVLFSLETSETGRRILSGYSTEPNEPLLRTLEQFCHEKLELNLAYEPGGLRIHRTAQGAEFVFILLPLTTETRTFGVMGLAISRDDWTEQRAFAACSQVARLVSMNLDSVLVRSKLEQDLDELNKRTRELQRQSEIDALTQVENKVSFETQARIRLNDTGNPAALIVLDLDYFKEVNDIYGHQFGDTYLQTIARAVRSSLPADALIGRIGGDEFAALIDLPSRSAQLVSGMLARLRSTVQRNVALLGKPDLGQMSIGVSLFPDHAGDYARLFALADAALYESKDLSAT